MRRSAYEVPDGWRYAPSQPQGYWRVEIRETNQLGFGVFAGEFIPANSVVWRDGGVVVSSVDDVPGDQCYAVLIDENLYLAPSNYDRLEAFWNLNHSCEPNIARVGGLVYYSKKDVFPGTELTIDYAPLIAGISQWSMKCRCGSVSCRKIITGNDWQEPDIAKRLWSEWLPFIQKRIHINTEKDRK